MRFLLSVLTVFIYIGTIQAQRVQVKAYFINEDQECNTELKQIQLIQRLSIQDSILYIFEDTICRFEQRIELTEGLYVLRVRGIYSSTSDFDFTVNGTDKEIDLGEISLIERVSELEEVTITGVPKKFIQIDPEKTTVTVEDNAVLEAGTIYGAILKIPGIIPNPSGGFTYSGQFSSVFFEGIPSSLAPSDLDNLLRSLPATSVKKIELITNPGASYDANFSGAIIDIISHDKAFKWLSGSVSLNAGLNQNFKTSPTFILNGKAKRFTWNVQNTYSYSEKNNHSSTDRNYTFFDSLLDVNNQRNEQSTDRYYSFRGNITAKIGKKSILQLNNGYITFNNLMNGNSSSESTQNIIPHYTADYQSKGAGYYNFGGFKYRVFLDSLNRKLEIASNYGISSNLSRRVIDEMINGNSYSVIRNQSNSLQWMNRADLEFPLKNRTTQFNFGTKFSINNSQNKGAYQLNQASLPSEEESNFTHSLPYSYHEQNLAFYSEYKQRIKKKMAFTLGLRAEDFRINADVDTVNILRRKFQNLYPSVHALYRLTPDFMLNLSYSRKINMPYGGMYDPNASGYYDSYTQSTGNNQLNPNFMHRSQLKLTIFDYLQLSFTHAYSNSINFSEVFVDTNTLAVKYSYKTYSNVQSLSGFFSLPIPFGFFTQGVDFFRQPIQVDKISFLYLYTNWNKTLIPEYDYLSGNKGQWTFGVYSQFILPFKIRLNVEYNFSGKGMTQITQFTQNIHEVEAILSREFSDDKWRISASFQDILNTNRSVNTIMYKPLNVQSYSKWDTRIVWLKVAYSFGKYERPSLKEDVIPKVN